MDLVLHAATKRHIESFYKHPSHALLLTAPTGSGKVAVAHSIAAQLLGITTTELLQHPYVKIIQSTDGKAISIETVRELEHFLSLKVPGKQAIDRVVIIEDSHLLGIEAQNALLKTLEEPPNATVLILTADHPRALLPTITSRLQTIHLTHPSKDDITAHFLEQGFDASSINQAYSLSGGLPGLMHALLSEDAHPLTQATEQARQILKSNLYKRLLVVDSLSRNKSLARDTCFILGQMAHVSLQNANGASAKHWQKILEVSYGSSIALDGNAQSKLVLTNLMLNLS